VTCSFLQVKLVSQKEYCSVQQTTKFLLAEGQFTLQSAKSVNINSGLTEPLSNTATGKYAITEN